MKRLYKSIRQKAFIIAVVIVASVTVYQLVDASLLGLFDGGIKTHSFRLKMPVKKAKRHFSSYGKLESSSVTEGRYGKITWLTYRNNEKDETLTLKFRNDNLCGFSYHNWQIK